MNLDHRAGECSFPGEFLDGKKTPGKGGPMTIRGVALFGDAALSRYSEPAEISVSVALAGGVYNPITKYLFSVESELEVTDAKRVFRRLMTAAIQCLSAGDWMWRRPEDGRRRSFAACAKIKQR